jgi:hypothetical protein
MKNKKQQYIYIGRHKTNSEYKKAYFKYVLSKKKLIKEQDNTEIFFTPKTNCWYNCVDISPFGIKIKKGEQVRIPIDIDKKEVVE